jgi:hypothetical protein
MEKLRKIVNEICLDMGTSAPNFIEELPAHIKEQADNIPADEIEDFAIGEAGTQLEIARRYNVMELHEALDRYFG